MLHIISQLSTHFDQTALFNLLTDSDVVLFIQDGVYNTVIENDPCLVLLMSKSIPCYVLEEDVLARGLCQRGVKNVHSITYEQFVDLTVDHTPQLLW